MRVAILGRSELLLNTAQHLQKNGHTIALIGTAKSEAYYKVKENDFMTFAEQNKIPYFCSQTLNSPEILDVLQSANAEIAVSINWPNLVGEDACNVFLHGILNAHAGDLPRYRGNACPNWAILNGEEKITLAIHQMDPNGLDSGDVFQKVHFPIDKNTYISDIYDWLNEIIPLTFTEVVSRIEKGDVKPTPQSDDPSKSLRCYPRKPEDGKIHWANSATNIHALIRASSHPFDGAFGFLESGEKVTIWKAELRESEPPFCAIPGQILYREDGCVIVSCGNAAIKIIDASIEGETAKEYAMKKLTKSVRARLS